MCPVAFRKADLVGELGDLAGLISKPSVAGEAWFLSVACSKMQEETDKLKEDVPPNKEPEPEDAENSQPAHIAKIEKASSRRKRRGCQTTSISTDQARNVSVQ